jgi:hypothetical protein
MAIDLKGEGVLVIYNDSHPHCRVRATLMEEFFHLWLGHPPSVLRFYRDDLARSYNKAVESQAYGSGAAALLPYRSLRTQNSRRTVCFGYSESLRRVPRPSPFQSESHKAVLCVAKQ